MLAFEILQRERHMLPFTGASPGANSVRQVIQGDG